MSDYRIKLDIFAGPLDLLLYLVRKEEVDVYDIPIAQVTDQYLQYVELLKELDMEVVGEFLVMAATLMEIKSAMLLPKIDSESLMEDGDADDPRSELVRQLLEYKKFKDAANLLNAAVDEQNQRQGRPNNLLRKLAPEVNTDVDMDQIGIWDLLEAFDAICRATGQRMDIRNIKDDTPIDLYQIEILHRLQNDGPLTFRRVFEGHANRLVLVGRFLGMLELIRNKLIWAEQADNGELFVRALTEEPAEIAVQRSILAVQEEAEAQADTPLQSNIPIQELPPKSKSETTSVQTMETPIEAQE